MNYYESGRQVTKVQAVEADLVFSSELTLEPVPMRRMPGLSFNLYIYAPVFWQQ